MQSLIVVVAHITTQTHDHLAVEGNIGASRLDLIARELDIATKQIVIQKKKDIPVCTHNLYLLPTSCLPLLLL